MNDRSKSMSRYARASLGVACMMALAACGPAMENGATEPGVLKPPGAQSEETDAGPRVVDAPPLFVSFVWQQSAEACPEGGEACTREFRMVGAGTMTDVDHGRARSVRARSEDYHAFASVATDAEVRAAMRESASCDAQGAAPADSVTIQVDFDPPDQGHLEGCAGPAHERLRAAVERLRAAYFPAE